MNELGSSHRTRDRKNGQGKRAEDISTTRRDASKEQTPSESGDIWRQTVHFTANGVIHSSKEKSAFAKGPSDQDAKTEQPSPESGGGWRQLAQYAMDGAKHVGKAAFWTSVITATAGSAIEPASAKDLSNNDRYALSGRDDRDMRQSGRSVSRDSSDQYALSGRDDRSPQPSRRDSQYGSLETRRGSSGVDSLSRYTGRGHDAFSQLGRGDHGFAQPTQEDVRKLLEKEDFPHYLNMVCEQPQKFARLLKNKAFLQTIDPLYLDEGVLDFLQRLCNDPERQESFLKLAEQARGDFKKHHLDTIRSRFGNDERHDKGRETDHPPIQKRQQNQEYEAMPPRTMQRMQDTIDKMLKLLDQKDKMYYETDKMRMEQAAKDKDRRFNSEEPSRKRQEEYGKLVLGAGLAIGVGYLIAKCCSERQESITDLVERAKREDEWLRQEQQQLQYASDLHQSGYTREVFEEVRDQQGYVLQRRHTIFGNTDAMRQDLQSSGYRQDSQPSGYRQDSQPSGYRQDSQPSGYRQDSQPSGYRQDDSQNVSYRHGYPNIQENERLLPDRQRSENDPEKRLQIEKISDASIEDKEKIKELKKAINELINNSVFKEEKIKDLKKRIGELEKRSLSLDDLIMFFKNSEYLNDICQRKDVETIGKLISHLGGDVVMMRLLEIRRWNMWFFFNPQREGAGGVEVVP